MTIIPGKSVKVFNEKDGKFVCECDSVKNTAYFLMPYSNRNLKFASVRCLLSDALRDGTSLFGFTFEVDPNYVCSQSVRATKVETGETFDTKSVGRMALVMFGNSDGFGSRKVSELCRSNGTFNGFKLSNIENGFKRGICPTSDELRSRPVLQLNRHTSSLVRYFNSATEASHFNKKVKNKRTHVESIRCEISSYASGYNGIETACDYKWRFVRPNELPVNLPLPPPNNEGL